MLIDDLKKGTFPEALSRNHPTLTAEEQIQLLESKVVIIGQGGLGGHLSNFMARMGIGSLVLVDGDVFDHSNLNRQILATENTLGKSKAKVTSDYCKLINPEIETSIWATNFTAENGEEILDGADLVLDALDQIPMRKTLFSIARKMSIPFIHGAVAERFGQTSTFLPEDPYTIDTMYPADTVAGGPPSVLAPTVAVIASIQALEAVNVLCGHAPANAGKLVLFDGEEFTINKLPLKKL